MIFVARQRIPDEPSCTTSYQRLVEPKQNPEPKLRALRGSFAETTIASIHLLVAHARTNTNARVTSVTGVFAVPSKGIFRQCCAFWEPGSGRCKSLLSIS